MKKLSIFLTTLFCIFFISCASNSFNNLAEFPVIDSGELDSGRYIVLGEVTGSSSLSMTNDEYSKLIKNEFAYDPQNINVKFGNDTGSYGFVGKPKNIKMNVFERSAAIAEYQMIETAKYNEADAIICFKSYTSVIPTYRTTTVKTEVSGLAVKIKTDSGYSIKQPVVAYEEPAVSSTSEESEDYSDIEE